MTNKIRTLKKAQEFLNDIPFINEGGCGISSLSLYRWLKKEDRLKKAEFVYLYNEEEGYLNNQKVLREEKGDIIAPSHSCLLYKGNFIDSAGKVNIENFLEKQIIEEEFIIKSINNKTSWNGCFNREYGFFDRKKISEIEYFLNIDLGDIKE